MYTQTVDPTTPDPVTIECDELLELEHIDGQHNDVWALVNRQHGGLVCDDLATLNTFVVLRIADKSLWSVTFDIGIADHDGGLLELTQVRMVSCLAVAYVEVNDSGEAMPVLALKPPQVIRDHMVRPEIPDGALKRMAEVPGQLSDILTITRAINFVQLRCIELQGPAENPPVAS